MMPTPPMAEACARVFGVVAVAALGVDDHGDAQNGRSLDGGLRRAVDVAAAQVDVHQQRPTDRDRAVVERILATQVDHGGDVAHRIQIIGVRPLAANDDRAGGRGDLGHDAARSAGHGDIALLRIVLQLFQQRRVAQGDEGLGGGHQRAAVHLLHEIDQLPPGAAIVERVPGAVIGDHHGIDVSGQLLDFGLGQRRQGRGVGHFRVDQGLLDDLDRFLGAFGLGILSRGALRQVELVGDDRQQLRQAAAIVENRHVDVARELLGLGDGPQRMPQHVVVPGEPAVARQLRTGVGGGGGIELVARVALETAEVVCLATFADRVDDFLLQDFHHAGGQRLPHHAVVFGRT